MNNKIKRLCEVLLLAALCITLSGCDSEETQNTKTAYRQYGINCIEEGKYDEALEAFQKALDLSVGKVGETELDICFYKAEALYKSGKVTEAVEVYDAIIDYNEDPQAYYLRGCLYFGQGQSELGIKDLSTAANKSDKDYELYIGIYQTFKAYGMEDDGKKYLNEALNFKGEKAYDNMQKGRITFLMGDNEGAKELLQKAVDGKEQKAYYYLSEVHDALGDTQAADASFQSYLESGLADAVDLYETGVRCMEKENYQDAVKYFEAALELEEVPNRQFIMQKIIYAYEYVQDFQKAKTMMEEYKQLYPEDTSMDKEFIFLKTR